MDHAALVATFQTITNQEDEQHSTQVLQSCDWNLEAAVANHFAIVEAQGLRQRPPTAPPPPERAAPAPPAPQRAPHREPRRSLAHRLAGLVHDLPHRLFSPLVLVLLRVLDWALSFLPLSWRIVLAGAPAALAVDSPAQQTRVRAALMQRCPALPVFEGSYLEALRNARRNHKFVLAYLHSHAHQHTNAFCRDVLGNAAVAEFITNNFVLWVGDVNQSTAFELQSSLGVCDFPCLVVVGMVGRGESVTVLHKLEGLHDADATLQHLTQVMDTHGASLLQGRLEQEELQEARRLREEQDREFRQAMLEEQLRQQQEEERRQREEEERLNKERLAEQLALAAAQHERSEAEARAQLFQSKLLGVPPEPASGGVVLAIRLPNGTRLVRRFPSDTPLQKVKDFVDTAEGEGSPGYDAHSLVSTFPRKVFSDLSLTLEEAQVPSNAILVVEAVVEASE